MLLRLRHAGVDAETRLIACAVLMKIASSVMPSSVVALHHGVEPRGPGARPVMCTRSQ